jgi:hypothetical protein
MHLIKFIKKKRKHHKHNKKKEMFSNSIIKNKKKKFVGIFCSLRFDEKKEIKIKPQ